MAYQEVDSNTWKYEKEGDAIEGKLIKVESDIGPNKSMLYSLETNEGNFISVWGSTVLDQRMSLVKEGDKIRITYKGLGEKKGGKNAPKLFKVEVDKDVAEPNNAEE